MASDRLVAIVLSSNLFAAGVNPPVASALFGVHVGGPMDPFVLSSIDGVREIPGIRPPIKSALALKLFEALEDSLRDMRSREDGTGRWNKALGGGTVDSAGSSDEMIRGVAFNVPHVISCFTAAGPSSEGVGEGMAGTSGNFFEFGDPG